MVSKLNLFIREVILGLQDVFQKVRNLFHKIQIFLNCVNCLFLIIYFNVILLLYS